LLLLILFTYLPASHADSIGSWLNSAVYSTASGYHASTQSREYYFGGGFGLKTPQETIVPFHITPPSIKGGCGGIDIAFGGFSYLNPKYLMRFAEKVVMAAPAMAFQMALQTFCPSCEGIMNKLTSLANMINGMNMNSCQAATSIAGAGMEMLSNALNVQIAKGNQTDWLRGVDDTLGDWDRAANELLKKLSGYKGDNKDKFISEFLLSKENSFLDYISNLQVTNNILSKLEEPEKNVIRYLFGDIVKYHENYEGEVIGQPTDLIIDNDQESMDYNKAELEGDRIVRSTGNDKMPAFQFVGVRHTEDEHGGTVKNLLHAWIYGIEMNEPEGDSLMSYVATPKQASSLAKMLYQVQNQNQEDLFTCVKADRNATLLGVEFQNGNPIIKSQKVQSICSVVGDIFKEIEKRYGNYEKLDDIHLKWLSLISFPVYKLLNTVSILPGGVADVLNNVIDVFTIQYLTSVLELVGQTYMMFLNQLQNSSQYNSFPADGVILENLRKNISDSMTVLSSLNGKSLDGLRKKLQTNEMVNNFAMKIEAQIARHPIAGSYFLAPLFGGS
jgi:hypothetical protein